MCAAIRSGHPQAKVVTTVFPYHSVGRSGLGDFSSMAAVWQNRYPFRPLALTLSETDYIGIHLYPANAEEFHAKLRSVEFEELKKTAARRGKKLLCTEFGVWKKDFQDQAGATQWAAGLQQLIIDAGFEASLFWQHDTLEQPKLWPATKDSSRILSALASHSSRAGANDDTAGEDSPQEAPAEAEEPRR
jgi:endo-1,4-beta-mannosidase